LKELIEQFGGSSFAVGGLLVFFIIRELMTKLPIFIKGMKSGGDDIQNIEHRVKRLEKESADMAGEQNTCRIDVSGKMGILETEVAHLKEELSSVNKKLDWLIMQLKNGVRFSGKLSE